MLDGLATDDAAAFLHIHPSSLWKYYRDCRRFTTPGIGGAVVWDRKQLLARQEQLHRQRLAAIRARARERRMRKAS